jgi:hypothetical protein
MNFRIGEVYKTNVVLSIGSVSLRKNRKQTLPKHQIMSVAILDPEEEFVVLDVFKFNVFSHEQIKDIHPELNTFAYVMSEKGHAGWLVFNALKPAMITKL